MAFAAAAVLFAQLLQPVFAQSAGDAAFTFPDKSAKGLEFYDNTKVIISFECPENDLVNLRLYCRDEEKNVHQAQIFEKIKCSAGEYPMRVDFDYYASKCWLNMRSSDGSGDIGINSGSFGLSRTKAEATFGLDHTASVTTSSEPSATESSDASSTSGSAASESTEDPGSSGNSDSSSSNNSDSESSGLSPGAKAGIGVGAAVGVVGIVALIVAFWLVRRKKNNDNSAAAAPAGMGSRSDRPDWSAELQAESGEYKPPNYKVHEYYEGGGVKNVNEGAPVEAPGEMRPYEMPDTSKKTTHELYD